MAVSLSPLPLQFTIKMSLFHFKLIMSIHLCTSLFVLHVVRSALPVSAYVPELAYSSSYATTNGTLYVQAGFPTSPPSSSAYDPTHDTSAFFSLSLSKPWNDTAPPWKLLPSNTSGVAIPFTYGAGMAATPDGNNLVLWAPSPSPQTWVFHPKNNSWSMITYSLGTLLLNRGGMAVIDPESFDKEYGNIYAPSGARGVNESANGMCGFDLRYYGFKLLSMPPGALPINVAGFSFTYCTQRKSMMLYGGHGEIVTASPYLFEYLPIEAMWTFLTPLGNSPGDLSDHCKVETTDGSKMIVFGGVSIKNQYSSRLFFLNLGNFTWTEGADAGAINARSGHVCATNGDSFVVWGGQNGTAKGIKDHTPLIYNIPTNQWVHDFVVSGPLPSATTTIATSYLTATTTSATMETSSTAVSSLGPTSAKSSSTGSVIGGTIGGLVVIASVGFLVFRRHRRAKNDSPNLPSNSSGQDVLGITRGLFKRGNKNDEGYDEDKYHDKDGVYLQGTPRRNVNDIDRFTSPPFLLFPDRSEYQRSNSQLSGYYSVDKEGFSTPRMSPGGTYVGTLHGHSPQFFPGGSNGYSVWFEGDRVDPRSPQQFGPVHGASPAAWMAMMKAAGSTNDTQFSGSIVNEVPLSPRSHEWTRFSSRSSCFPSTPGQQHSVQIDTELLQKRRKLMKAQYELDLEKNRLERESQMQLIGGQFLHRG